MARGKKRAKELTPEEKLTQALVPIEEQPYQIPENWCWTYMNRVAQWGSGGTPSRKNPEYYKGYIPWIKTGELNDGYVYDTEEKITDEAIACSSAKIFPANTIAIAMYGATIGKVGILGMEAATNQACACGICLEALAYKFLFYYARSQKGAFIGKAKGGAQPNISQEIIKTHFIPLPPLAEQQRIVDRIESIFAKLDEAKERAQEVVDGFEMRKSAILHKAFTGELTKKWREEHRVTLESWRNKKINQVTVPRTGYAFESKKFCDKGYQIIRMGNLYAGQLDLSRKPVFISEDDVDDSILKHALVQEGDILITLTGTKYKRDYGYAVCITEPEMLLLNQRILCLSTTKDVERNYILYYLKSKVFRDIFFSNETGGVNQGNVSSKFVENIEIKIPLREEQCEIVQVLERMMEMEQQAKEIAEAVIEQIDVMKKAVLARAFRGELGTNDPKEESAMELLKRVL